MYLVFASKLKASGIINELATQNIESKHIQSMDIESDEGSLVELKEIANDFDYIIFTSPTAIEFASKIIPDMCTNFLTVGKMTTKRLSQYISVDRILYPLDNSGVDALIDEVLTKLNLDNKKVLLVKGDSDSLRLTNYLASKVALYQEITIYHYKYLPLDLKPLLFSEDITGVFITSSVEANYLFSQAKKFGYFEKLKKLPFITIHQNIIKLLKSYGIGVVEYKSFNI